jgi:chromosome segregation ATPase
MSDATNKVMLPFAGAAAIGSIALGLIGFTVGYMVKTPDVKEVLRAPTEAELEAACAPEIEAVEDELGTAQAKVADLERTKVEQEKKVNELEARIAKGAEVGKALREELAKVKAELAETQEALAIAEEEKEKLLVELTQTQEELEDTKVELVATREQRDEAREDALYNRWQDFLHHSQLEICDKGNRKKLGNCREEVTAALEDPERQSRFAHCIRSGQAQPMVRELEKDASLPEYSEMMNEEVKQVKGWFVEFCDPTLPELSDVQLAEGRLPPTQPSEG